MLYVFSHSLSKYGIVIDAGSSHSALWMFSWDSRKVNNTGVISTYDREEGHSSEYLWILLVDSTTTGSWYYKVFIIINFYYCIFYIMYILLSYYYSMRILTITFITQCTHKLGTLSAMIDIVISC